MKSKTILALLALMLCVSVFSVPALATDIPVTEQVPVNTEWIEGETLPTESTIPNGNNPFTPNGNGSVVDNASEQDGKEFFTFTTENGNTFYLIIDRQRADENVYLLNAVTESDLIALAAQSGAVLDDTPVAGQESAIPTSPPAADIDSGGAPSEPKDKNNSLIFVILAVAVAGVAGYYFKIVRPKQNAPDDYEDESDYEDDSDTPDDDDGDE